MAAIGDREGGVDCAKLSSIRVRTATTLSSVRACPAAFPRGHTREEAIENMKEAIQAYTLPLQDQGLNVPVEKIDAILLAV